MRSGIFDRPGHFRTLRPRNSGLANHRKGDSGLCAIGWKDPNGNREAPHERQLSIRMLGSSRERLQKIFRSSAPARRRILVPLVRSWLSTLVVISSEDGVERDSHGLSKNFKNQKHMVTHHAFDLTIADRRMMLIAYDRCGQKPIFR